jgi:apolipoprotein D and lipocalin family protein
LLLACSSGARNAEPELEVVDFVDLQRYIGTWYEIARFPHRFQEGCIASKATYTLREDGKVDVLNQCRLEKLDGKEKSAKGKAWIVDKKTNAKLKVSFFWPFSGDYWIIDLGENYEYAVVGHPDRTYLWILSRTPTMKIDLYAELIKRIKSKGYDTEKLLKTPQLEVPHPPDTL